MYYPSPLKETPFHARVATLCRSHDWRRWAGYRVASKYDLDHEREYHAIRNAVALIDVSPLYKYVVTGPDAVCFLNRLMVRDFTRCRPGQVRYTAWCDEKGKVIEDGTVACLDETTFRLATAEPNLPWFEDNGLGLSVSVSDVSEELAALALQGPLSRRLLVEVVDEPFTEAVRGLRYYRLVQSTVAGRPVEISRTGYTGDLGFELWTAPDDALAVWDALAEAGVSYGLAPAGMLALDVARIEAGLVLVDADYTPAHKALIPDQLSSPYELAMGWMVDLDRDGYFNGRRALAREAAEGPAWRLTGIEVDWESMEDAYDAVDLPVQVPHLPWRQSVPLYTLSGREAGYATSGCFSPLLKRSIALATLRAAHAAPGTPLETEITVEHMRRRAKVRVVPLPFLELERRKGNN